MQDRREGSFEQEMGAKPNVLQASGRDWYYPIIDDLLAMTLGENVEPISTNVVAPMAIVQCSAQS